MIKGRFGDTSGRPFIEAKLYLPRFNISGDISFIMDTGADSSMIMPGDSKRLAIPFDQLIGDSECEGVGGIIHCFVEPAILAFTDPGVALYAYQFDIDIMQNDPDMESVPSLLGRDVLDQWRITYDPKARTLRAKVHTASLIHNIEQTSVPTPAHS